jgi:alkylhydroperoxidase family enzyme
MARLPYAKEDQDEEVAALAAQIRKERGQMHNLYLMLLNSPPVARGWLGLLTAVRQQCKLPGRFRELAILRIALLNRAHYEYEGHVPFAVKAGLSQQQIDGLPNWKTSELFNEIERAVLTYTEAMTKDIQVPDAVFAALQPHFATRELTELTATIATYNLVSRFLEALKIDSDH